jgi:hypothetical protein
VDDYYVVISRSSPFTVSIYVRNTLDVRTGYVLYIASRNRAGSQSTNAKIHKDLRNLSHEQNVTHVL